MVARINSNRAPREQMIANDLVHTSAPTPDKDAGDAISEMAAEFQKDWQAQVAGIVAMGRKLIQWKHDLRQRYGHGHWGKLVKKLPISHRTADYLMKIAQHPVLGASQYVAKLPPCWGTLTDLAGLPGEMVKEMIADGRINPDMERSEAVQLIKEHRDEGLYRFERISESVSTLVKFMRRWPEPQVIAERIYDVLTGEGQELDIEDVSSLADWLRELERACKPIDSRQKAREANNG